jgi:crotonobetainyl-CoA:carnitine CoA-transferase CaiB-like acyl-CoA transferase
MTDALQDVTVVEFGAYAAGPAIGKYLANFGARVIHVESRSRPDGFRLQYPPYKDHKIGVNRSGCFAFFNDSKFGVTLNLKEPAGLRLAERLVARANVVIENLRPGVMDRLGLGYERLRQINPSLVMLSTCNLGQTGPYATQPGFGSQLSSLSGFTHLIGAPDGPPNFLYGPYIDFVAVVCGGAGVLAALDRQRTTGQGAFIDLSQYESGLQFIGAGLLDFAANGAVPKRNGNRDPQAVPHGCFRARDGRWVVLSCWNDEEWQRLCVALECHGWSSERFATAENRRRHEGELNELIAARVAAGDADALVQHLQSARVHAAVVAGVGDLFSDPQLAARHAWQPQEHPEIGRHNYRLPAYQLSETPGSVRAHAPCLGQHNQQIFREWLGLSEAEFAEAEKAAAFS